MVSEEMYRFLPMDICRRKAKEALVLLYILCLLFIMFSFLFLMKIINMFVENKNFFVSFYLLIYSFIDLFVFEFPTSKTKIFF